ncbi:MAG: hypothetical protein ABIY52_05180 [Gemmatimonadaceae bacterium]
MRLLIIPMLLVAGSSALAQAPAVPSADVQIARAVTPLPDELQAGAAVLGYKTAGKLETIRAGKNDMVCLEPDPEAKSFHTACYHKAMEPFMARGRSLRAEGVKGPMVDSARFKEIKKGKLKVPAQASMMYQIFGGTYDAATSKVTGGQRLFVTYIPFATATTTGLSAKPSDKLPWIMFPGTPKAHIMFSSSM